MKMNNSPYEEGRAAFRAGADRLSCPYPAPYNPPRSAADLCLPLACKGAFWLDGYEQERDEQQRRIANTLILYP